MKRTALTLIVAVAFAIAPTTTDAQEKQLRLVREQVFAAGWQGGGVYRLAPTGAVAEQAKTALRNNKFLAWSASRRELYVAADNGGTIEVLVTGPLRKVASIREGVGWNATSVAVSPDGATLYAVFTTRSREHDGPSDCRLAAFDLATRTLARSIALADRYEYATIALSGDGARIFVSRDRAIEVYDAVSFERVQRFETVVKASTTIGVARDGASVFTAGMVGERGAALRRAGEALDVEGPVITPAFTLEVSRDGSTVWVASGREIVECDAQFAELRRIELPGGAIDVEESLDGRRLYVLSLVGVERGHTSFYVVDLATGTVTHQFETPSDVRDLLVVAT